MDDWAATLPKVGDPFDWTGERMPARVVPALALEDGGRVDVRAWEKPNPSPLAEQDLWLSEFEYCVYARKPGAYHDAQVAGRGAWVYPSGSSKRHPTEKPLPLFQRIVRTSCPPDGIVCDPCSGSGTAGEAAVSTGRRFVGWELAETWHRLATFRIKDAADQLSIFG
jgi:DNA modification methylase